MWSLYFTILQFLKEDLEWRRMPIKSNYDLAIIKFDCINNPKERLWVETRDMGEVRKMFRHLKRLEYKDRPNYDLFRNMLKVMLIKRF
jgi:hypothetical protein